MYRRTVLVSVFAMLAGCGSITKDIRCTIDQSYYTLRLDPVPEEGATQSDAVVVQYSELSSEAQQAVDSALSEDDRKVKLCVNQDGDHISTLVDDLESAWREEGGETGAPIYLHKDRTYYVMKIDLGDVDIDTTRDG